MPNWKKVVVSGSSAHLNHVTASGHISGSSTSTGSFGQLHLIQDNSPANPTLNFGDGDSGFYESSDDVIRIATGGNHYYSIHSAAIQGNASNRFGIQLVTPTSTLPTFTPNYTDSNTGIGWSSADKLSLIAGGVGVEVTTTGISGSSTSTGSFGSLYAGGTGDSIIESTNALLWLRSITAADANYSATVRFTESPLFYLGGYITYDGTSNNMFKLGTHSESDQETGNDVDHIFLPRDNSGDVIFPTANAKISGSSTSTGSFGSAHIAGKVGIGTASP